jgi:hypothetical protein
MKIHRFISEQLHRLMQQVCALVSLTRFPPPPKA